MSKRDA
ncbi:hypothetical protein D030_1950A, partial [Vibrio parahaemolyticus AQ3810]